MLSRREALQRLSLVVGGAVSAPVASALLAGCQAPARSTAGATLGPPQLRLAGALAERILPRTDTPGALDAGVDLYIDEVLTIFFSADDRRVYLDGLKRLDSRARELHGANFVDCDTTVQDRLLEDLDSRTFGAEVPTNRADDPDIRFFRFHKELTVAGYYTSQAGQTEELRPMPFGEYKGDTRLGPDDKSWV